MKIHFLTATYNRPDSLKILLDSIQNQTFDVQITLVDDGSKYNIKDIVDGYDFPIQFIKHEENWGKHYYWKTVTQLFESTKDSDADYFIMIPDDMYLYPYTIEQAIGYWNCIEDSNKIALIIHTQHLEDRGKMFGEFKPIFFTKTLVIERYSVDGIFFCEKKFFKELDFHVKKVGLDRWKRKPEAPSGVTSKIRKVLRNEKKHNFYMVPKSIIGVHENTLNSNMNSSKNHKRSLLT